MSKQLRFGLASENAYFNRVDQLLLENLRETLELQEEARRCAEAGRRPDRDLYEAHDRSRGEQQLVAIGHGSADLDA